MPLESLSSGGKVRIIVDVSYPFIDHARELLNIGEDVCHIDQHGVTFVVFDRKSSMTAISIPAHGSLSSPMAALWTDDPTYSQYLASTFEMLWKQSVPAAERIQEL